MKKFTIYKTESKELNEYQLSLVIHMLLLVAISILMALKTMPKVTPKVTPVTLIAQVAKPKTGAVAPVAKQEGSRKAVGNTEKVTPKQKTASPVKADKPKSVAKPIKKALPKPATKPNTKNTAVKSKKTVAKTETKKAVVTAPTSVVAVKPAQTNLSSVVQIPTEVKAPVKPNHNLPLFEEVSDMSVGMGMASPLQEELSGSSLLDIESMLMPESSLDDSMVFSAPTDVSAPVSGVADGNMGAGVVEVGEIEAFGGTNENFIAPTILKKVQPDYPEWARKQGVHGNAVYRVLILPSGTVGDVVTMSSTIDPKLAIDGAQALRRWVFTPVLNNGIPQETWVKISVGYELN